ncbi:hypothetical protein J1N35_014857, partial [Gossypium stocksii]
MHAKERQNAIGEAVRNDKLVEFVAQGTTQQGQISRAKAKDKDWTTSNAKKKAHIRSVMSVNTPKSLCQLGKQNVDFSNEDEELVCDEEGNDPMVVSIVIAGFEVKRILVDSGSVVEEKALKRASPLYGSKNHPIEVKGGITLTVTLGDGEHTTT